MASVYKTAAAVCFVALYGLQSEAAGTTISHKFIPIAVEDAGYVAANLARNGKLPVHINAVAKDDNLVSTLTGTVKSKNVTETVEDAEATIDETCSSLVKEGELKDIFHYTFEYNNVSKSSPNYRELLQKALDAGLEIFKKTKDQNKWEKIWEDEAGASLAYLLGANSTTIGCVIGQCIAAKTADDGGQSVPEGATGKAVLFCELNPAAKKNQAPFDDEYFEGLIARTAKLADMTEEDLKAPSNDGTAAAAVPTILAAGLVAVLTAISA
ncbi:SAG family member [Eimeria brunetti]|uniref:SAG family member n=1 Tax=Eimeria brunetti TaxID=51314 RepID=U6L656_9EIME|nr:SAG family member [Eimeria brunetti]